MMLFVFWLLLYDANTVWCAKSEEYSSEVSSEGSSPDPRGPPSEQVPKPRSRGHARQGDSQEGQNQGGKPKHDPDYYPSSYYSSSKEAAVMKPTEYESGNATVTTVTPTEPPTEPPETTPIAGEEYKEIIIYDDLTAEAWAVLPNWKDMKEEELKIKQKWQHDLNILNSEDYYKIYEVMENDRKNHKWFEIMCYQLGSTLFNAKTNLRNYYRLRYAYYNNKLFEVGYIVHEIVYKYTALLEFFHNVQYRYYNQSRFFNIATGKYMLYMYTIILEQSQQVIHFCNVLHEIDRRYSEKRVRQDGPPDPAKMWPFLDNPVNHDIPMEAIMELERQRLERLAKKRAAKKKKKEEQKLGVFHSTRRKRWPVTQNRFRNHYGWSIEDW